jgi:hypothetical protein
LLEQPIAFEEAVEVVVIFLEPEKERLSMSPRFSFYQSLALTPPDAGNLSDTIIEERRNEKW